MNDRDRLRLFALLSALEEGVLAEADRAELVSLLKSSDEAQHMYLAYQGLSSSLSLYAREHVLAPDDELAELAEMEASAPAHLVDLDVLAQTQAQGEQTARADRQEDTLTAREIVGVLGYVGRHAIKSRAMRFAGFAAVLLLGVALFFVFAGNTDTPNAPLAEQGVPSGAQPNTPGPSVLPVVATLTAEHNAVWAERALARGSELHPGQRLNLIAGFAQITTNDGAIAILEAPATIELLDNDNALRLHAGKLVGICETESSKGFVVRTPHVDITDLGTRFGVAIDESGQTLAQVFEGSVRVEPRQAVAGGFDSQVLLSGKDITVNAQGEQVNRDQIAADTFTSLQAFAQFPIEPREGIASITGDLQWTSRATGELNNRTWSRSNQASIHQELAGHRLGADVAVSYHLPGVYTQFKEDTPSSTIPDGTSIRCYFIGLKAEGPGMQSSRASITFDGEILGIIAHETSGQSFLDATHNKPHPVIPMTGNSLESGRYDPEKVDNTDMIEIGQDRRTLTFAIQGVTHIDYFRVIVRDHVDQEADQN